MPRLILLLGHAWRTALLAVTLTATVVAPAFGPMRPVAAAWSAGERGPSIQAQELALHARDGARFAPGDRVTVPYTPPADDSWQVGGVAPRALPAGRASGRAMARETDGARWATGPETTSPEPTGIAVAGADTTVDDLVPAAFVAGRKQVFGFLPYWELTAPLNYKVLSTIAYFSVEANRYGNLVKTSGGVTTSGWSGWTSAAMTNVINNAHRNGVRVVLTVTMMAWSTAGASAQAAFLASSSARLNLARQIAAAVRDRGADGVNLDFEPIVSGGGAGYAAFVRTLRAQLNTISTGYQLTADATGWVANYPLGQLNADGALDAMLLMGYDFRTAAAASAGSIDPLPSSSVYDLRNAVDAFAKYLPPSKIILGLPWYGRAWSTTSNALHAATHTGSTYGYSVSATYDTAASLAALHGTKWDAAENSAWTAYTGTYGTRSSWRELYWDNPQAEAVKADFINARGLRGAGIWALGYNGTRQELYNVLAAKFPGLSVAFAFPAAGRTVTTRNRNNTITWSTSAPAGVKSVVLTELYGKRVVAGSCANVAWRTAWSTSHGSPFAIVNFLANYCYRYTLTVTDSLGRKASVASGNLLIAP